MDDRYIVNIGRQLGSGGHEIGEKIAQKLGFDFYDKELITIASERSGLCEECFEKADEENASGVFGSLSNLHFAFINESAMPNSSLLSHNALFKIQSDVIKMLASIKSCVFIGRCADYILRDESRRCANIFISADIDDRVQRIMKKQSVSEEYAKNAIAKCDKKRAEYYNYYTTGKWGAASTYHLCINSSVFGVDGTVDYLIEFIKKKLML
jgi:cytidylate kinase